MLDRAVAALKSDEPKALREFNDADNKQCHQSSQGSRASAATRSGLIIFCKDHNSKFERAWRSNMTRSALIVFAVALLLVGTSLASAKSRSAGAHSKPSPAAVNQATPRPTQVDPYYRLSDAYYGDSDPYHGLFNFYAVPPYSPGNSYGYVRRLGR